VGTWILVYTIAASKRRGRNNSLGLKAQGKQEKSKQMKENGCQAKELKKGCREAHKERTQN